MKHLIIYLLLLPMVIFSQSPIIQWQKGFGGSYRDLGNKIIQKPNGNYIICGYTNSQNYNSTTNHSALQDLLFMELDSLGSPIFSHCYGGFYDENGNSMILKNNDNIIVLGTTQSSDDDLLGVNFNVGYEQDIWILNLDSSRNISWQKAYGSPSLDKALDFIATADNGFLFLALSGWSGDEVDTGYGESDLWLVKTDSVGNIEWQTTLGSEEIDDGGDVIATQDGGYLITGCVNDHNGNVQCSSGSSAWVVKVNNTGNIEWQNCYVPGIPKKIISMRDGGYVIGGDIAFPGVQGYSGYRDMLLFKIDSLGNQEWAYCYGGSNFDYLNDLINSNDGGIIAAGSTDSRDNNATSNHGFSVDALIIKLDSAGNLLWNECYGDVEDDECNSISATSDGGLILTGATKSTTGLPHYGFDDLWVMKLSYSGVGISEIDNSVELLSWSQKANGVTIELNSKKNQKSSNAIYDSMGKLILNKSNKLFIGSNKIDCDIISSSGIYFIQLLTETGSFSCKIIL